jgi:hypothetical protein
VTSNSKFFYKLNKRLLKYNIKFKILNLGDPIPDSKSIILTTRRELTSLGEYNKEKSIIIPFNMEQNFEEYIINVITAYKLGSLRYQTLTFSIDPGTKSFGLCTFINDYFLNSHTLFNKRALINKIKLYIQAIGKYQDKNKNIRYTFKIGRGMGVLPTTKEIIKRIFLMFEDERDLEIYLVDESKSSKIKIYDKGKRFPKHEASALILALRKGIKVEKGNYKIKINKIQTKKIGRQDFLEQKDEIIYLNKNKNDFKDLFKKIISADISISDSIQFIRHCKQISQVS